MSMACELLNLNQGQLGQPPQLSKECLVRMVKGWSSHPIMLEEDPENADLHAFLQYKVITEHHDVYCTGCFDAVR